MLAGVSVEYYTRLERGNLGGVSDSVLDALAQALRLDDIERDHLYALAHAANARPARARRRPTRAAVRPRSGSTTSDSDTRRPAASPHCPARSAAAASGAAGSAGRRPGAPRRR
ncbi:helix-turn-helix domain-containing protein [Nonomuraea sp. NPDC049400]|uniref:helix-turn-helix domain-containing protein n=1 Tax=Nonomuraea sp. NPDC049400 TaxID=3364352 RepID=UPI0037A01EF5